jgi:SAM-dependent methyltransferase
MPRYETTDVRSYYDRHTSAFVTYGQGRSVGAIHRAVWAPGVQDAAGAFRYVDDQIAALARELLAVSASTRPSLHIVDLGCGIGASLCHLASQLDVHGTGVTVSPVQVAIAKSRIADANLSSRVQCVEADYCDLPASIPPADLAYAIESFVHAPSARDFFEQCRRLIRPGGLLIICDDVRGADAATNGGRAVEEFCAGWHVNALLQPEELRALASAAGFEHEWTRDLTPFLELRRWRDRAIGIMLGALKALGLGRKRFDDLAGGQALQTCLRHGWVRYELAVFRRRA